MDRFALFGSIAALAGLALLGTCTPSRSQEKPALFPFTIPWDDAAPSVANVSAWNETPAGKHGFISVRDGHFVDGAGKRIRFFGTNLCFAADFPPHEVAEKVAKRMAKFGINIVRFHHMDNQYFPSGIWDKAYPDKQHLSPEALDRLDYLISQLKQNGIYADLNLHVSRTLGEADGIQEAAAMPQMDKGVDNFHPRMIELQKQYARDLLTHVNAYTHNRYADEPAVAMIEINNENSLVSSWASGEIDRLPKTLQDLLDRRWNEWLKAKYGTTEGLRKAWAGGAQPLSDRETLKNGDFAQGPASWDLEIHPPAAARLDVVKEAPDGGPAARIEVTQTSDTGWYVQFHQAGLAFKQGDAWTLSFWAKADPARQVNLNNFRAHDPWGTLGLNASVDLGKDWKQYTFSFTASETEDRARIGFSDLAGHTGTLWLAKVSLKPGGIAGLREGESLEAGTVTRPRHGEATGRTPVYSRDYVAFLLDLETEYWTGMAKFIREQCGAKPPITGTQMGYTPPTTQAAMDYIDSHAYWHHPWFPGRPWDGANWWVTNRPMTDSVGGTLTGLASTRVAGKPYTVSEYNHPAPNTYGSEAFLLLAAYGALQDWDALFQFAYNHGDQWDVNWVANFFDLKSHITQLVTLPAAVALFRRGDVSAAREEVVVHTTPEAIVERGVGYPSAGGRATAYDVDGATALSHRVAVAVGRGPVSVKGPQKPETPQEGVYASDTGQLQWTCTKRDTGFVSIDTPRSKALIGFVPPGRHDLGEVALEVGATRQNWAAVTVTAMEGARLGAPGRLLITATGYYENPGWAWETQDDRVTVRNNWGKGPSMAEGVPGAIELPVAASRVKAFALDGTGSRTVPVTVTGTTRARIEIGPQYKTLWYEVVVE